jgi:carboxyl-terminal processing protease
MTAKQLCALAALLLGVGAGPSAAQTPNDSAAAVLERYVEALGGRARMSAIRTLELEQRIVTTDGRRTERTVADLARGRWMRRVDAPPGVTELGYDGTRAWRRSIEETYPLPGDAPEIRALRQFARGPERYRESGVAYVRLPDRTADGAAYAVLRGPNGVQLDFNRRTGLLAAVRQGESTLAYGDYRRVDGWSIPFELRQHTPDGDARVTVVDAHFDRPVPDSIFAFDEGAADPPTAKPGAALTPAQRERSFDIVWGKVAETSWDTAFARGPWRALREPYRRRALAIADPAAFHALLGELLAQTHRSHYEIIAPDSGETVDVGDTASADVGLGLLDTRLLNGVLVVVRVPPASPAARAGLRAGDVLERVDDLDVAAVVRRRVGHAPALGREEGDVMSEVWNATLGGLGSSVRVRYRREGASRTVTIARAARHERLVSLLGLPPFHADLEWSRLAEGAGYLRLGWFIEQLAPVVDSALDALRGAPALVIDLRGNPGGEVSLARHMAARLIARPETLMVSRTRLGDIPEVVWPAGNPFRGRVILLVDHLCASSCEALAAALQASGRAVVVGERSSGALLVGGIVALPSGARLLYAYGEPRTTRGAVIEGHGVAPDVEIPWSRAALAGGRDPQLEAAVRAATTK